MSSDSNDYNVDSEDEGTSQGSKCKSLNILRNINVNGDEDFKGWLAKGKNKHEALRTTQTNSKTHNFIEKQKNITDFNHHEKVSWCAEEEDASAAADASRASTPIQCGQCSPVAVSQGLQSGGDEGLQSGGDEGLQSGAVGAEAAAPGDDDAMDHVNSTWFSCDLRVAQYFSNGTHHTALRYAAHVRDRGLGQMDAASTSC
ncbi:hypothetical protein CBL_10093 [Carabus blaptoides fortunei]